jgi:rhodanese-related sulfurtransferase/glyoxylase-like metal-dependent hydrolase (beta-lactamase superfamily II)
MFIKQLSNKSRSSFSYYVESNGEAIVIDPFRIIEPYVALANERFVKIKYIFESQFHTEFISGHLDLANATGAKIVFGPKASTSYNSYTASDEEIFQVGDLTIKALHTPGYSIEHTCYLLTDNSKKEVSVFTGNTLLKGGVCNVDFFLPNENFPIYILAAMLFESLNIKLGSLQDKVVVYPGFVFKDKFIENSSNNYCSTIGEERKNEFGLKGLNKESFIEKVNLTFVENSIYLHRNAKLNQNGYINIESLIDTSLKSISIDDFIQMSENDDFVVLDTRKSELLINGFIPNSINISFDESLSLWSTRLVPSNKKILLLTEIGKEKETLIELFSIGIDNIIGFLEDSFDSWINRKKQIDLVINIEVDELLIDIPYDENLIVLDIRNETDYDEGHLKQSINIPLKNLVDVGIMADFDDNHNIYVLCENGENSMIACTLLKRQGIHNVRNVSGGWKSIKEIEDKFSIERTKAK